MKCRRLALWIVCVIALGVFLHSVFGRPMRYEFPGGFRRWVVVHFEDPSCPPLRSHGVFLVISVPTSGQVCTSTRHPEGRIYYRFEYVYPNGKRESLRLRSGADPPGEVQVYRLTYNPKEKWEVDFVGTKEEAEHWGTLLILGNRTQIPEMRRPLNGNMRIATKCLETDDACIFNAAMH